MTPEQLDEIEKLAEVATPGPWKAPDEGRTSVWSPEGHIADTERLRDVAFICAMREHALPLVTAVREAVEQAVEFQHAADEQREAYEFWRDTAEVSAKERDEAKAERDEVLQENIRLRTTMHFLREKAGYYRSDLEVEGKLSPSTDKFRQLIRDKEWITDGRESVTYCLWCQRTWQQSHAKDCEMFGPAGFVDPEVRDKE